MNSYARSSVQKISPNIMLFAISATAFCASQVAAQTIVPVGRGTEMRYHGDTIWRIRDTTVTRSILHGDTLRRVFYTNGVLRYTNTYVQKGDNAILIEDLDSAGKARYQSDPSLRTPRTMPVSMMESDRMMLESAVRMWQSQSNARYAPPEAPLTTSEVRTYPMSANLVIVQFRDTVRYIRGCAAAPPVDTTTYVLFGLDSAHRVSPAPRKFDGYMAAAIRGDMSSNMLRTAVASQNAPPSPPLPALNKWPCDKR